MTLWQIGCNARLHLESEAGNALVRSILHLTVVNMLELEKDEEAPQLGKANDKEENLRGKPKLLLKK